MYNSNLTGSLETFGNHVQSNISEWNHSEVINWLKGLNLSNLLTNFEDHKINGYDLCMLNSTILKEELRVNSFHDRNVILKSVKEHLLNQCNLLIINLVQISFKYMEKNYEMRIFNDKPTSLGEIINYFKDVCNISQVIKFLLRSL